MERSESQLVRRFSVKRVGQEGHPAGAFERMVDSVATEEPLAIRISYWFKDTQHNEALAVTMRTPGHDIELAAGLLLAEGIIRGSTDITAIRALGAEPSDEVLVELAKGVDFEAWRTSRNGFVSSSCGVCGKRSREAIAQAVPVLHDGFQVAASVIERLPGLLRQHQQGFAQTGGLHAAALVTSDGALEAIFEDIGRHNALDKVIGWALRNNRVPLQEGILFLSSRSSFELIQKASMAGAPLLATVGGPSSLAVETAREQGLTLIGFVRDGRFNIYSGEWRIHS
ncbi:MAG TPA: formate dehydrogenase accessory sulfurtransferase FdhD [Bryobacteraceae bacterium]|nr:formate dehydrogenase accessory sulfurtransferase FdhD [Bryobacteraceae bacterium]